jgi:hypothetical protein
MKSGPNVQPESAAAAAETIKNEAKILCTLAAPESRPFYIREMLKTLALCLRNMRLMSHSRGRECARIWKLISSLFTVNDDRMRFVKDFCHCDVRRICQGRNS